MSSRRGQVPFWIWFFSGFCYHVILEKLETCLTPPAFLLSGSHSLRHWKQGISRHAWAAVLCAWRVQEHSNADSSTIPYQGRSPQRLHQLHLEQVESSWCIIFNFNSMVLLCNTAKKKKSLKKTKKKCTSLYFFKEVPHTETEKSTKVPWWISDKKVHLPPPPLLFCFL